MEKVQTQQDISSPKTSQKSCTASKKVSVLNGVILSRSPFLNFKLFYTEILKVLAIHFRSYYNCFRCTLSQDL